MSPRAAQQRGRGPHRQGSTAGSWAPRQPGCGHTARRRSTPPGPGTAGTTLGADSARATLTQDILLLRRTPSTGPPGHLGILPHVHPRYPGPGTYEHDCPSRCFGCCARLRPPAAAQAWSASRSSTGFQPSMFCKPHTAPDPQPPRSILRNVQSLAPSSFAGRKMWREHYLVGRAGRAPWAAAPSCCCPGRSGPSWQWTAGPGSAGSRPVPSCSGTRLPAGASWTLGDTTDPNNPEKLPRRAPSPFTPDPNHPSP